MIKFLLNKTKKNTSTAAQRTKIGELAGRLGLLSNLLLFAGKFVIGLTSGSVSIMADAMNSLSDTVSSVLTLIGFRIAAKPADSEHPFGHQRFEYISGLVIAFMITFVGFQFLLSSIDKIRHPEAIHLSMTVFVILILSIIVKIWQGLMYARLAKEINSDTLLATGKDSLNDVFTTIVVLASALIEWATGVYIDGFAGLLLSLYIIISGLLLVKGFIGELLGSRPSDQQIEKMEERLTSYTSILGYHDLLVHDYGPQKQFASVHIEVDANWSLTHAHQVIDQIEKDFQEILHVDLVCHLDPVAITDKKYLTIARSLYSIMYQIDPQLRLHDFRIKKDILLQFDVVVPDKFPLSDTQLRTEIKKLVREEIGEYHLEITFDHNYLL